MTDRPALAISLRIFITLSAVKVSNPVVGSSTNSKLGFVISSVPMETR